MRSTQTYALENQFTISGQNLLSDKIHILTFIQDKKYRENQRIFNGICGDLFIYQRLSLGRQ